MQPLSPATRKSLETQGFVGLGEADLVEISPWVRVVPAILLGWTVVGTLLGSPAVLWALVPVALLGTVLPRHPLDAIYDRGIRPLLDTQRLPPTPAPRRVAFAVTALWLAAIAWTFHAGNALLGRVLGGALILAEIANVALLFCVVSWAYRICAQRLRRSPRLTRPAGSERGPC